MEGPYTSYTVEAGSTVKIVPHGLRRRKSFLKWIGSSISHRLFMIKARLLLLLVLCAAIMITALLTWKISLNATERSCKSMSTELRHDVTQGAMQELKAFLVRASTATYSMYRALDSLGHDYSRLAFPSLLPLLWGAFSTNPEFGTVHVATWQDVQGGYRRNGPEAPLLGSQETVGVPSQPNDTLVTYGYIPDPVTGQPQADGPRVIMCLIGISCPAVMDTAVYIPASIPPTAGPVWSVGKSLAKGSIKLSMAITSTLEPNLQVVSSIKDKEGKQVAVLSVSSTSTRLRSFLQDTSLVRRFHGRVVIVEGSGMRILSATHGPMYTPPATPGARPTFLSAVHSTDEIIRDSARLLNATYGAKLFMQPIQERLRLGDSGDVHYVSAMPLDYEGMQFVVILVVPRHAFYGAIDDSHQQGLIFTMVIVVVMFVVGGLAMCMSTTGISRKLETQEKNLGEASAANRALREQLLIMTQVYTEDWPQVDMGTPLEKLTAIIKRLRPGRFLSQSQVQQMQALITAGDLHKPQFLAKFQSSDGDGGSLNVRRAQMDSEMGTWLELLTLGRRSVTEPRHDDPLCSNPSSARSTRSASSSRGHWAPRKRPAHLLDLEGNRVRTPGGHRSPLGPRNIEIDIPGHGGFTGAGANPEPTADSRYKADAKCVQQHRSTKNSFARFLHLLHYPVQPMEAHNLQVLKRVAMLALPAAKSVYGAEVPGAAPRGGGQQEGAVAGVHQPPPKWDSHARISAKLTDPSRDRLRGHETELVLLAPLSEEQQQQAAALRALGEWEFDTLELEVAVAREGESVVPLLGYSLFLREGLILEFGIDEHKLANFLVQISRGMEPHPYHNAAHVADVSASLFHLLTRSGVGDHLRSIDKLAALVAALIHDYKHPGVNNDFLSRTREDLATVYNDHSPLENFHLAEAFQLLYSNEHCNFLDVLSDEDFMELRRVVIEVVLATDLKRHFGVLDAFKARVSQEHPWDEERDSDRILLLQMALKVADIGHTAKPLKMHTEWTQRVCEEFYKQGDAERDLDLNISPFMDRNNNNLPRSQLGFFQFLAMPLMEAWVKSFPRSTHLLSNMSANIEHWKRELQACVNFYP